MSAAEQQVTELGFGDVAAAYAQLGYQPVPLIGLGKGKVPSGYTGYKGKIATSEEVAQLAERHPLARTCIRLAPDQVGLDVDDYADDKSGRSAGDASRALAQVRTNVAPDLPLTVRVSSRLGDDYDGESGIKLYRLPPAYAELARSPVWNGQLCPGVDHVRFGHRNVNVWPSTHPVSGQQYGYLDERTGEIAYGVLPPAAELPVLPAEWCELLLSTPKINGSVSKLATAQAFVPTLDNAGDAADWWTDGDKCRAVQNRLDKALGDMIATRPHDPMRDGVLALTRLGEQGHTGVAAAVAELHQEFDVQSEHRDRGEWQRAVVRLHSVITAGGLTAAIDKGCCDSGNVGVDEDSTEQAGQHAQDAHPDDLSALWSARPELAHVQQWAWAQGASATTTLACVLVDVLAAVPPSVLLPPTIGGPTALNLNVALVGESGIGKGLAPAAAAQLLTINSPTLRAVRPIGSGEGMSRAFAKYHSGTWSRTLDSITFVVDEVGTLDALSKRLGSTLGAMIKTAFMGNTPFGFTNAEAARSYFLEPYSYRLCLQVGVQPGHGDVLLRDAEGGTPQRFLWPDAIDPEIQRVERPPNPWQLDLEGVNGYELALPDVVVDMIKTHQLDKVAGRVRGGLDGHRVMLKLRVAAALMFLAGRRHKIEHEDWELAELVLQASDATRRRVGRTLDDKRAKSEERHKQHRADTAVAVDTALRDNRRGVFVQGISQRLKDAGGSLMRRELLKGFNSTTRPAAQLALEWMTAEGLVVVTAIGNRQQTIELVTK